MDVRLCASNWCNRVNSVRKYGRTTFLSLFQPAESLFGSRRNGPRILTSDWLSVDCLVSCIYTLVIIASIDLTFRSDDGGNGDDDAAGCGNKMKWKYMQLEFSSCNETLECVQQRTPVEENLRLVCSYFSWLVISWYRKYRVSFVYCSNTEQNTWQNMFL